MRAMFDRIAGFYDLMNSVMTAGLHHRWRERAADLARLAAGRPGARRRDRHRRPGDRAGAARRARRRGGRLGLLRGRCSSARARRRRTLRWEWGNALALPYADDELRRRDGRLRRAQLLRPRARAGRDGAGRAARAAASSCSRSRRRRKPPLSTFFSLWFDRVVPLLGRLAGEPEAYTLPAELGQALPGPGGAGRRAWPRAGLRDVRWILTAGGIIALHVGDGGLMASAEAVAAVIEAGGAHVPGADGPARGAARRARAPRTARCWPSTPARRSPPAASGCGRCSCSWPPGRRRATTTGVLRAAVAVELVHSATLVHDDVLDAAALRRGRPTVVAAAGRAHGDRHRRPAVLARVRRAGRATAAPTRCACSRTPPPRWPQGELLQRADAWDVGVTRERYLQRCELKTARLFEAACRLGALEGGGAGRAARALRAPDRARVPAARRRARRLGPGRAHRQAPRHRPARRHGDAAADPRARARPGAGARSTCARCARPRQAEAVCDAIAATARWRTRARRRSAIVAEAKAELPELPDAQRGALELVADGVVERYASALEVHRPDERRRRARRRSARSRPPCWPASGA